MEPIYKTVRRTWAERLFSLPFTPFDATKQVRDYKAEFAPIARARPASMSGLVNRPAAERGHVPPRPMPARPPSRSAPSQSDADWP